MITIISAIHCQVCDTELSEEELDSAPFNKNTHSFDDICFECLGYDPEGENE